MSGKISGVILAGGSNKRFGGIPKANVVIGGKTIISRMISTIRDLFDEIIIVTNNPEEFLEFAQYKIVNDEYLNAGPLGGIHAAFKASSEDAIFVFAGDMPFLDGEIITGQINEYYKLQYDILIPEIDRFIEPLHAIYRKSVLNDLEKFLLKKKSRAVRDFLKEVNTGYFEIEKTKTTELAFGNINSPSDLTLMNETIEDLWPDFFI